MNKYPQGDTRCVFRISKFVICLFFMSTLKGKTDEKLYFKGGINTLMEYLLRLQKSKFVILTFFRILLIPFAFCYQHISLTDHVICVDFLRCANNGCECSYQDAEK